MRKKAGFGLLGIFLLALGLYRTRRRVIGRWLRLPPPRHAVRVRRGIRVAMPDGIHLATDHYAPKSERLSPTILIRTPYGRGQTAGWSGVLPGFTAQRFAERGYNVLVQDVRGRFDSEGAFIPFFHEAEDGLATLKWIESQDWFNGVLGMYGHSYVGYTQWAAAAPGKAPLYLKAILPAVTSAQMPRLAVRDGAYTLDTLLRWVYQLDAIGRRGWRGALSGMRRITPRVQEAILGRAFTHLPLEEADLLAVGKVVPSYRESLRLPPQDDPYWQAVDHSSHLSQITAAVHLVSGWYDLFLRELLEDYARLVESGRQPYLTIGPYSHLDFECTKESMRQAMPWFDAHLKGDRRGLRKRPVRIYVMGEGGWRDLTSWPPPARRLELFLHGGHPGSEDEKRGSLSPQPPLNDSPPDGYIYDPADPTPAVGGAMLNFYAGARDNRRLEARPDVLTFTTLPLEHPLEIIGGVHLRLYVSSNRETTDFFVRVCDVHPDGRSINITDGFARLRPGIGQAQPDGSTLLEIGLWPTAMRFQKGHSIRLQVSSGAHPRWNRNSGFDEPPARATRMAIAEQLVYHDPEHPSVLVLADATVA